MSLWVNELWKSVKTWRSYCHEFGVFLSWNTVHCLRHLLYVLQKCYRHACCFLFGVLKTLHDYYEMTWLPYTIVYDFGAAFIPSLIDIQFCVTMAQMTDEWSTDELFSSWDTCDGCTRNNAAALMCQLTSDARTVETSILVTIISINKTKQNWLKHMWICFE